MVPELYHKKLNARDREPWRESWALLRTGEDSGVPDAAPALQQ